MIVLVAIIASGIVFGITVFDAVKGRTAIGGRYLARTRTKARFWAAIAFYFGGSCVLLVLAAFAAQRQLGCPTGLDEPCVITIHVAPK